LFYKIITSSDNGRIKLEKNIEKECSVVVTNSQSKDNGLWRFTIGRILGQNYKETKYNHYVVVTSKGKFVQRHVINS
jgi:hypothetical protein